MTGRSLSKLLFAMLLIGIGIAFLLSNFDVIELDVGELFSTYWPVAVIWVGVATMISAIRYRRGVWGASLSSFLVGVIIALLGWNFLADNLGLFTISFGLLWNIFWPLLLIYIGFKILFRNKKSRFRFDVDLDFEKKRHDMEEVFKEDSDGQSPKKKRHTYKGSLIGDINMGRDRFELENMHLWNGIGDVDLDLRHAILPEGESKVLINGWIGDIDVIIPKDMPIYIEASVRIGSVRILDRYSAGVTKPHTYKSPGYDEATQKVHMIVELKIGDVMIVER